MTIDMRDEFEELLEIEDGEGAGRWVLLRKFSKELTTNWKPEYREAVGGPKYKFVDLFVRAYSTPGAFGMAMAADGLTRVEPADIPTESVVYYVSSNVDIEKKDLIFEINWREYDQPSGVAYEEGQEDLANGIVRPTHKAEVLKVVDYASTTAGGIEYKKVFTEEHSL